MTDLTQSEKCAHIFAECVGEIAGVIISDRWLQNGEVSIVRLPFIKNEVHEGQISARLLWDVMTHWLSRKLSTGGSWVRLPL